MKWFRIMAKTKEGQKKDELAGAFVTKSSVQTEDLQWRKYKAAQGHGFSAEDANALNDRFHFKEVEKVGISNEKNGADRISNGISIQTKYCKTAKATIDAAFENDIFRYEGMKIEVPKDQYEAAVELMRLKITDGKIPGVSDPSAAEQLILKGSVTYKQAENIAKAGNLDSVFFDIKTQTITCTYAFGISAAVEYLIAIRSGVDKKDALKLSLLYGTKTAGIVGLSGVVTQQMFRTVMGRKFAAFIEIKVRSVVNSIFESTLGKKAITGSAKAFFGNQLTDIAARNTFTKFCRTNVVTGIVTVFVLEIPDFYRAVFAKTISYKQFAKNFIVAGAGVSGGVVGGYIGGALGATAGGFVGGYFAGPGGVTAGTSIGKATGSLVGGTLGSVVSTKLTKKGLDKFIEDDSVALYRIVQDAYSDLSSDYLISDDMEENQLIAEKVMKMAENKKWLREMYKADKTKGKSAYKYAYDELEPIFQAVIKGKKPITTPNIEDCKNEVKSFRRILFWQWVKIFFEHPFKRNTVNAV